MNHVTFETAQRLEASGFPTPSPCEGQIWYTRSYGYEAYVGAVDGGEVYALMNGEYKGCLNIETQGVFAPTATDILKELKGIVFLFEHEYWCIYKESEFESSDLYSPLFAHENPAEAAAMAWIQKHEKK